jgi:hypothetical protein
MSREVHVQFYERLRGKFPQPTLSIAHCVTQKQALYIRDQLAKRLKLAGLEMHPEKTKIVYCKDSNRREKHPNVQFT